VTLAARVAEAAATAARLLASRTPVPASAPIPASPSEGFEIFAAEDAFVSRDLHESTSSSSDDSPSIARSDRERRSNAFAEGADSDDTRGTFGSSEFGGLPGAESFLRDAAARRAWDVVVGLIASSADGDTEDESSSFLRTEDAKDAKDASAGGSESSTGSRTLMLNSAERERKRGLRKRGDGETRDDAFSEDDFSVSGKGSEKSARSLSSSRLGRSSGQSGVLGSDRSDIGSIDTLPGADEWLKSPGARGAVDAHERSGVRGPFEDDADTESGSDDARADRRTDRATATTSASASASISSASIARERAPSRVISRSVSPSPPPPPSDRQLAEELRQKINSLRIAARRSDDVSATARGPSPLSRTNPARPETSNTTSSGEYRDVRSDRSGSASLDPTFVLSAEREADRAYDAFAAKRTPRGRLADPFETETEPETGNDPNDPNVSVDASFRDALDATARSEGDGEFASFAGAGASASPPTRFGARKRNGSSTGDPGPFDADALVSSTFHDVFGGNAEEDEDDDDSSRDEDDDAAGADAVEDP
jgi:hypothetical protein